MSRTPAARLLREDDKVVYGDSAYLGIEKREEIKSNPQLSAIEYRINLHVLFASANLYMLARAGGSLCPA